MSETFDFISATDRPALIAFSTPEWLDAAKPALEELNYKVHTAATHGDFQTRFTRIGYEVIVIEELFCASVLPENQTVHWLQTLPMTQRRHSTVILVGESFQTFNALQAFQQSVHTVVNSSEMFLLRQLIEKAVSDNNLFLSNLKETQARIYAGKTRE